MMEEITKLSQNVEEDAFNRKVLKAFVNKEGRIVSFPAQEKKFLVLLCYVVEAFELGRRYSEKRSTKCWRVTMPTPLHCAAG